MREAITSEELGAFKASFDSDRSNLLSMNAVTTSGLNKTAMRYTRRREDVHGFSVELPQHDITAQKQSGRCWMYAGYNVLRDRIISKLNLKSFSFSGNYLMFYDKLEKANLLLELVIKYIDEPSDSRDVMGTMAWAGADGGYWSMFVNLVRKYGVVPQEAQPETVSTDKSTRVAPIIEEKLREYARDLRRGYRDGKSLETLRAEKEEMLDTIYRMYCICYGEPVKKFDFKVRDKDDNFICDRGITPKEFYDKYIGVDLTQYVPLTAGATNGRELKKYILPDAGDMVGGIPVTLVTVPVETLKSASIKQLKAGEPVWFACDVRERYWREGGLLDSELYGYKDVLNIDLSMSREDRFAYRQARFSHAMVLKGVDIDDDGKPVAWRVENSWGKDVGNEGMFIMTDGWFDKYVYQTIINREYLPEEILKVSDGEAIEREKWQVLV